MLRIVLFMVLGAALFFAGAYQLGLFEDQGHGRQDVGPTPEEPVAAVTTLGNDLYDAKGYPEIVLPGLADSEPIEIYGIMNPIEWEEVPSQVPGRILFVGEEVDAATVLTAGSAAFLSEPYYTATIYTGGEPLVKVYRRLYEGQTIKRGQMLAMIEPPKAIGEVLGKKAKIELASAELTAAIAGEAEGLERYERAIKLWNSKNLAKEDLGAAKLTYEKLKGEKLAKFQGVEMAKIEKYQADIELSLHEIRALLPYKSSSIKSIVRQRGFSVKPGDPVIIVQNLERLQAEALIEEQYFSRIRDKDPLKQGITATIEPTILEAPKHEFPGHALDVTCVAVAKDMQIVSGSEDRSVCIWKIGTKAPMHKLEHDDAVKVIACTPVASENNHCLAGCANGSIYLWDLTAKHFAEPVKLIEKAHGSDTSITALAYSLDGKQFASGASDGSIRLWSADGTLLYAFIPANGVKQCHEDAVTSLHFTPQCKLVSAGRDKTLRVWQLKEKGAAPDGKVVKDREGNVSDLGVSQDGKWMLFDQVNGKSLKLLSVKDHKLSHSLNVPANSTPFEKLALFSPEIYDAKTKTYSSLILTAGAAEGRLQLWRTPDGDSRGFEVRQFATRERLPVACAAFSPDAGKGGANSFAVSASGHKVYVWTIPTKHEIDKHRIKDVQMTLISHTLDASTRQTRIGFEVPNLSTPEHPNGRFEAGRPVKIVIE